MCRYLISLTCTIRRTLAPITRFCRFVSDEERQKVIADQADMGLDNTLEDAEGYIRINLFVARPEQDAGSEITLELST